MNIKINFKNQVFNKSSGNYILFTDEKFNISSLKKHISSSEYTYIFDILKTKDLKKKIIPFEINSKKKKILVSLKKNLSNYDAQNLGAECYQILSETKIIEHNINSETIQNKLRNLIGHFLHGIRLKSYKFQKYKTKKDKKGININVYGKNIPNQKDRLKFKAVEEGTFYTRDLVSEPGNVLHPDEYAKRLNSLKKIGLKINI